MKQLILNEEALRRVLTKEIKETCPEEKVTDIRFAFRICNEHATLKAIVTLGEDNDVHQQQA
jgi:hypothetical protein